MAALTFQQIFGNDYYGQFDTNGDWYEAVFVLNNFRDVANGGQIENGLGISDLNPANAAAYDSDGNKALNVFYAIMLLIIQNQADNINADPEQRIFISDGGKRFAPGNRAGQIQRVFNVNIFIDDPTSSDAPDIDDI